ncbi:MAG: cytochrome b/b6 domain-containing protein [Bdellovibrionaceae bacterium]|nr:cytochrome b/b6 domain-containing protein [Pseudobdellovibrionaceae bacterium]
MDKAKVYDLPTRLFHWLFAGLFIAAFAIAKLTDDESTWFSQHMLLGLILFAATTLRIIWGIIGPRYARLSAFPLNPLRLIEYFREILSTKGRTYFAHNPASAWAAIVMIGLAVGLGITGYLMGAGQKEAFEDIHELMANAFAFVAVAHVAGVVLHSLRHRDGVALSMIHGMKNNKEGASPIASSHRLVAMGMAGIIGLFAFHIYKNYDAAQATTSVFGVKLQLGENESAEHHGNAKEGAEHEDDDD